MARGRPQGTTGRRCRTVAEQIADRKAEKQAQAEKAAARAERRKASEALRAMPIQNKRQLVWRNECLQALKDHHTVFTSVHACPRCKQHQRYAKSNKCTCCERLNNRMNRTVLKRIPELRDFWTLVRKTGAITIRGWLFKTYTVVAGERIELTDGAKRLIHIELEHRKVTTTGYPEANYERQDRRSW